MSKTHLLALTESQVREGLNRVELYYSDRLY